MIKLMLGRIKEEHAKKHFNNLKDYNDYYGDIHNYEFILIDGDDVYILENELTNIKLDKFEIRLSTLNYIYNHGRVFGLDELKFYNLIKIMEVRKC